MMFDLKDMEKMPFGGIKHSFKSFRCNFFVYIRMTRNNQTYRIIAYLRVLP